MSRKQEELIFKLRADAEQLKRELGLVEKRGQSTARKLAASFKAFLPVASVAGVALLGKRLAESAKEALEFADAISESASKLGVTTDFLQELRFAADQSGLGMAAAETAFARYSKAANEAANDTGAAQDAFAQLRVELRNGDKSLRSSEQTFGDTLKALAGIADSGERLKLAIQIFGKGSAAILNMAGSFDVLREQAREMGIVMDENLITQAAEAKDQLDALAQVAQTNLNSALISLGPILIDLAGGFAEASKWAAELVNKFRDVENLGRAGLQSRIAEKQEELLKLTRRAQRGGIGDGPNAWWDVVSPSDEELLAPIREVAAELTKLQSLLDAMDAKRAARASAPATGPGIVPGSKKSTSAAQAAAEKEAERLLKEQEDEKNDTADFLNSLQQKEAARKLAIQEALADSQLEIDQQARLIEALGLSEQAYISTAAAISAENEVKRLGLDIESETGQRLAASVRLREEQAAAIEKLRDSADKDFEAIKDAGTDAASSLSGAFADFATGAEVSLDRIGKAFFRNILNNELQSLLLSAAGGGGGSILKAVLSGFAAGGRPTKPSIVGENGPELFLPDAAGRVIPIRGGGGSGSSEVNVTIINNSGEKVRTASKQTGPSRRDLQIMVGEAVNSNLRSGMHDSQMGKRFGLRPVGI